MSEPKHTHVESARVYTIKGDKLIAHTEDESREILAQHECAEQWELEAERRYTLMKRIIAIIVWGTLLGLFLFHTIQTEFIEN